MDAVDGRNADSHRAFVPFRERDHRVERRGACLHACQTPDFQPCVEPGKPFPMVEFPKVLHAYREQWESMLDGVHALPYMPGMTAFGASAEADRDWSWAALFVSSSVMHAIRHSLAIVQRTNPSATLSRLCMNDELRNWFVIIVRWSLGTGIRGVNPAAWRGTLGGAAIQHREARAALQQLSRAFYSASKQKNISDVVSCMHIIIALQLEFFTQVAGSPVHFIGNKQHLRHTDSISTHLKIDG